MVPDPSLPTCLGLIHIHLECWKVWRPSLELPAEHHPALLLIHARSTFADTLTSLFCFV